MNWFTFETLLFLLLVVARCESSVLSSQVESRVSYLRALKYYSFQYSKDDDDQVATQTDEEEYEGVSDDKTFKNKIREYENMAKVKFFTLSSTHPKNWTAGQWGFFSALMTIVCFLLLGVYGAVFGFRRRVPEDPSLAYYRMSKGRELNLPSRQRTARDDDTIMRMRSMD